MWYDADNQIGLIKLNSKTLTYKKREIFVRKEKYGSRFKFTYCLGQSKTYRIWITRMNLCYLNEPICTSWQRLVELDRQPERLCGCRKTKPVRTFCIINSETIRAEWPVTGLGRQAPSTQASSNTTPSELER